MKKLLLLLAMTSIAFVACKKDDDEAPAPTGGSSSLTVEKKNRAAVVYFGEDWCPPCGSNGGPTLDSCLKQEGTLLTAMKVNTSSNNASLNWSTGSGMWTVYNSGVFNSANAIPSMAVNRIKQPVTTSTSSNYAGVVAKANAFAADSVIAGIALSKSIEGDSMVVKTKIKFFKDIPAGSDYRIGLYVVENDIVASQSTSAGTVANYVHHNMVRTSNANTYTGVAVNTSAAVTNNQEFDATTKMYLKSTWNKNKLKVIAILWKMGTTPATIVNSNVVK